MSDIFPSGKLNMHSLGHFSPPLCSRERFADVLGLPPGVVVGWCNKGLVPTVTVGKYSLINVELLRKRCLDHEFAL